jgi:hypothetical protein
MAPQISHQYRCIFVHVPKAGGTSIETSSLFSDQSRRLGEYVGGHLSAIEYQRLYPFEFEHYFKFAFVRNPYDRLVSAFHYLSSFKDGNEHDRYIYEKYIKKYGKDFKWFCIDFLNLESIYEVIHLKPQYEFICDRNGNLLVDFIGKIERLNKDFLCIKKHTSWSGDISHRLKTKHKHYSCYYSKDTYEIVTNLYKKDLVLLNYSFNSSRQEKINFLFRDLRANISCFTHKVNRSFFER